MKLTRMVVTVAMMVVIAVGYAGAVTRDSSSWEGSYEGDGKLGADYGWTQYNSADNYATVNSNAAETMTMDTYNMNVSPYYTKAIPNMDLATSEAAFGGGITVEWKVKFVASDYSGGYAACMVAPSVVNGGSYTRQSFGLNSEYVAVGGNIFNMTTTDDFHVYRLAIGLNAQYALYVDGSSTPVLTGTAGSGSNNKFEFGDETDGADSEYETDYFRWTDAGAIAPPPQDPITSDSSTWEGSYEGDGKLGADYEWTEYGSADNYATVNSNAAETMTMDTYNLDVTVYYNKVVNNMNLATSNGVFGAGITVEWKVKFIASDYGGGYAACMVAPSVRNGTGYTRQSFGLNSGYVAVGGNVYNMTTTDDFHVYRLTIDLSAQYALYVDGSSTPVLTGAAGSGSNNKFEFGDETNDDDSEYETDYFRWTDAGAIPFLPKGMLIIVK